MRFKFPYFFACFVLAFSFCLAAPAQTYSYRSFNVSNGLPGNYVNTICQDRNGLLWVGMETGMFVHDGFSFFKVPVADTVSQGYPCATFCDNSGKMWVGYSDGALFISVNGKPLSKIKNVVADKINKIRPDTEGNVWIITQSNGLYCSDKSEKKELKNVPLPDAIKALDIIFISKEELLLAAQDNLYLCSYSEGAVKIIQKFPELEYICVNCLEKVSDDAWAAGTDGSGLFIIKGTPGGVSAKQMTNSSKLIDTRVEEILKGENNNLLIATREAGVVKAEISPDYSSIVSEKYYNAESGLAENDVKTIFCDREGNVWIGLFFKGLQAVTTNAFSFYQPSDDKEIVFIGSLDSKIIMGSRTKIFEFDCNTGQFKNVQDISSKIKGSSITSWHSTNDGIQWIGTDGEGVFKISGGAVRQFFKTTNPGQNKIQSIDSDSRNLWLATLDGVVIVDRNTAKVIREYSTIDMLPHNKILQVVVNGDGKGVVATESDKLCYVDLVTGVHPDKHIMNGNMKNIIQSVSFSNNGNSVSVATLGNGVFMLKGDSLYNATSQEGLLSNYAYSVLSASDGKVWAGHEKGFSVWNPETGIIRTYSGDFGVKGDCLPNSIFESSDGHIFIGTTDGVIVYNPRLAKENIEAPLTSIISVNINGVDYPLQSTYSLPYKKIYSLKINYAGINLRDPLSVVYRTKLNNYDEDMSPLTGNRSIEYKLGDGHYHFTVEALSKENTTLCGKASFDIIIKKPFYRAWWFTLACILIAAGIVLLIIRLRDKANRKISDYLEAELSKRTREVQEQKEELLQKNQDITESIKYARRIQSSVLPDTARLGSVFGEAFVFFAPRDIVSGDFYWFDWVDKENFIVVCADSTGHGVPGAFMSMIGTALLQDIITRKKITRPSAILRELDRQVFSTLNQNQEVESANDGMDIIICGFNIRDHHLTFSSAMRPVIIIIDGEQHYVRGNRSSIGGDSATEKFYDDQEYFLSKGDSVYLFSDGYPDQFGGPGNKKMKISRLRTLIDDVKGLPMDEQCQLFRKYFYDWKGDMEQVDDVMLMGLRV